MRKIQTMIAAAALAAIPAVSQAVTVVTNINDGPAINNVSEMPFAFSGFTRSGEPGGTYTFNFFNDLDTPVLFGTTAFAGPNIVEGVTLSFNDDMAIDIPANSEASVDPIFAAGESFSLTFDYGSTGERPLGRFGFAVNVAAVPLPAGALLLTTALGGGLAFARRRKAKAEMV
ncbi:VPLPA-CTERM sorting domain-containing protein [Palleronia sp. LCG004]|uniref:VPLPA-CTERM sorting domain-containing protein n=1 Tax=Palleronia sp. LCG004 TaxID=3079304 RepID=UPI002942D537|nr:VPLPA-CTERM sorting domain-containing protein [Palleronia sp. LCG004]WOI58423.1 VPLPA-CTERM sorting domain-containing protein [Palleronia sp. LCG004]